AGPPLAILDPAHQAGANAGSALAMGDVNGDGRGDVAVGVPRFDPALSGGKTDVGRAFVFDGQSGAIQASLPDLPVQTDAHAGGSLAIGDFNHDGFDDLAVGESGFDSVPPNPAGDLRDVGLVVVYHGS